MVSIDGVDCRVMFSQPSREILVSFEGSRRFDFRIVLATSVVGKIFSDQIDLIGVFGDAGAMPIGIHVAQPLLNSVGVLITFGPFEQLQFTIRGSGPLGWL